MRVQYDGSTMKSKRLRGKALGLCLGACLCILGLVTFAHESFAQDSPIPSTSTGQLGISPEQPVAPPQPIIIRTPAPAANGSNANAGTRSGQAAGQNVTAPVAAVPVPPAAEMPPIPDPDPNNPVEVQSASLLKMAYELKSEVDKTTKDTLSVTVVRRASDIEQLARKMRSK